MATATIEIEDMPGGSVAIRVAFNPSFNETPAQIAALEAVERIKEFSPILF